MTLMTKLKIGMALIAALSLLPLGAAAQTGVISGEEHEALIKKDLFAVIALQGHSCGRVVSFERREEDYLATCETGDRYRVYVVSDRVRVEKQ